MSYALANLLVSGDQETGSLSMSLNSHLLLMKCIGPENQLTELENSLFTMFVSCSSLAPSSNLTSSRERGVKATLH